MSVTDSPNLFISKIYKWRCKQGLHQQRKTFIKQNKAHETAVEWNYTRWQDDRIFPGVESIVARWACAAAATYKVFSAPDESGLRETMLGFIIKI